MDEITKNITAGGYRLKPPEWLNLERIEERRGYRLKPRGQFTGAYLRKGPEDIPST